MIFCISVLLLYLFGSSSSTNLKLPLTDALLWVLLYYIHIFNLAALEIELDFNYDEVRHSSSCFTFSLLPLIVIPKCSKYDTASKQQSVYLFTLFFRLHIFAAFFLLLFKYFVLCWLMKNPHSFGLFLSNHLMVKT